MEENEIPYLQSNGSNGSVARIQVRLGNLKEKASDIFLVVNKIIAGIGTIFLLKDQAEILEKECLEHLLNLEVFLYSNSLMLSKRFLLHIL